MGIPMILQEMLELIHLLQVERSRSTVKKSGFAYDMLACAADDAGSAGSYPDNTFIMWTQSATVRVIGPTWSHDQLRSSTPARLIRP